MNTTAEVATILKLSADSVRGLIVSGRLTALNIAPAGKRAQYRIEQAALDEFRARSSTVKIEKRKPRRNPIPFRRYSA